MRLYSLDSVESRENKTKSSSKILSEVGFDLNDHVGMLYWFLGFEDLVRVNRAWL